MDLARAHLVYGEWERREKRRLDAREHSRVAREMSTAMGPDDFAQRSRRDLKSTGDTRTLIRRRLVLSRRTSNVTSAKVYPNLGITSRTALSPNL